MAIETGLSYWLAGYLKAHQIGQLLLCFEVIMRVVEFFCLLLVVLESNAARLGYHEEFTQDQLESEGIRRMVEDGLKSVSPCSKLAEIISGTSHFVNGMISRFQIRTKQDSSCGATTEGESVSTLSILFPFSRDLKPTYELQ